MWTVEGEFVKNSKTGEIVLLNKIHGKLNTYEECLNDYKKFSETALKTIKITTQLLDKLYEKIEKLKEFNTKATILVKNDDAVSLLNLYKGNYNV